MKTIIIAILLASNIIYSQKIIICDSITKSPIPFANISTITSGTYSDLNGTVLVPSDYENITVSHISYFSKNLVYNRNLDTIFLAPKTVLLEEVIISPSPSKKVNLGFLKRDKRLSSLPIQPQRELVIEIIPDSAYVNFKIEKIEIPLNKIKLYNKKDKIYKNKKAIFRLNIYTLKNEKDLHLIYQSEYTDFIMSEREKHVFDISREDIRLNDKSMFFGVEMIGTIDDNGGFVEDDTFIRPIITSEKSPDYNANTFTKPAFNNTIREMMNINEINKHLANDLNNYKYRNFNLAIGLILSE